HSTATSRSLRSVYIASIAATAWRPAFSIRTSDGMPMSSIVRRSASRIWAVFSTRMRSMAPGRSGTQGYITHLRHWCNLDRMASTVNVNGRVSDQEHAVISIFDHGFLYGEGVYETLRTYNGEPFLFGRHMRRLRASAGMLALSVPLTDTQIDARFRETMQVAGL